MFVKTSFKADDRVKLRIPLVVEDGYYTVGHPFTIKKAEGGICEVEDENCRYIKNVAWSFFEIIKKNMVENNMNNSSFETYAFARLEEFEHLEENWDSYGAPAIDMQTIEEARFVIQEANKTYDLYSIPGLTLYSFPNTSGGVYFYFEFKNRELRFMFYPYEDERIIRIIYEVDKTDPEKFLYEKFNYDRNNLQEYFKWLINEHS